MCIRCKARTSSKIFSIVSFLSIWVECYLGNSCVAHFTILHIIIGLGMKIQHNNINVIYFDSCVWMLKYNHPVESAPVEWLVSGSNHFVYEHFSDLLAPPAFPPSHSPLFPPSHFPPWFYYAFTTRPTIRSTTRYWSSWPSSTQMLNVRQHSTSKQIQPSICLWLSCW